jgi:hypothetical protein
MQDKIKEVLKNLPEDFVILTILPSQHYEEANLHLLRELMRLGNGSYITVNRPYNNLVRVLDKNKIDTKKLHFIDCITKKVGGPEISNCVFVDSPNNLTEIAIALEPLFKEKRKDFIFLDSLDTLTIYNDVDTIIRFAHFLTSKLRTHCLKGVMISVREKSDKKLISELSQFCDEVVDLT